jgi:N-acetyl sugar amidotransferase
LIQTCRRCLYPATHPFGITFDAEGICSGCRVHEEKDRLDWKERAERLNAIFDGYRGRSRRRHDCIVPVTGGRDSFYIVHLVRKVYGLNPLLVAYNRQYNSRAGLYNIIRLRTALGCDIITLTLSPDLVKRVMRTTLAECGSFHWHALAGHSVFPVQMAVQTGIPLIVWGAHQGLEQVGMFSHRDEVEMTRRYRREHDLMGLEAEELAGCGEATDADLEPFVYPSDINLQRAGVRGIYLGNYIRWDTKDQHERMIGLYDYYTGPLARTFDYYNDIDDLHFTGAHDVIKLVKHGYSKATDDACREIRFGRLSRSEAADAVQIYEGKRPADFAALALFMDVSDFEILAAANRHRRPGVPALDISRLRPCRTIPRPSLPACSFRTNIPVDFSGEPHETQLLTRGYGRE